MQLNKKKKINKKNICILTMLCIFLFCFAFFIVESLLFSVDICHF